jgi:ABC-type sugar transport system ATPase subunit
LLGDPKVIILDEPTAALGVAQTAEVLNLIERLRERGLGVIMISHNMADVTAVADRVAVLRLGRNNGDFRVKDVSTEEIIAAITGATDNVVTRRSAARSQHETHVGVGGSTPR